MQNAESLGALYIYIYISILYAKSGIRLLNYTPYIYVCTHHGKTSVIENYAKQELNKIEIKEDLRKDIKLSLICGIEKIKRTSYRKVVREEERKEKLELQKNSLSFF